MNVLEFVPGAAKGEPEAFRALVVGCWRFVYSICLSQLGDTGDAEDRTQEVFLAVYRDLNDLRDPGRFLPWLRRVTLNACRAHVRRKKMPEISLEAAAESADPTAADARRRIETRRIVEETLGRVTPKNRDVLALHYLAEFSEVEIAEVLEVSPSTVKSRLYEGRRQARRALRPLVRELLNFEHDSAKAVRRILEQCRNPDCSCASTLTERR